MSVGVGELLVVLVIALIVLGPKRLPDSARALGQAIREFRQSGGEMRYDAQQYMWEDRLEHEPERPDDAGPADRPV
ncbi:MAG TPA: twin-arginine translocase TatA/TatE family subunit [Solirubrobacteraceae bacterium]|nr:twin-arginine translocase TatA/TatE family subunit [Solirubrobacteraceae bacterium]